MTMIKIAGVCLVLACWSSSVRAQDVSHTCVYNCGNAAPPSSSTNSQPYQSDSAELKQIDEDNRRRAEQLQHERTVRSINESGIAEFRAQHWAAAIRKFENALALDPNNTLIQNNLARARTEQANEIARQTAPMHVGPKTLTIAAVPLPARLSAGHGEPPPPGPSRFKELSPKYEVPHGLLENAIASFRAAMPDAKDFTAQALLYSAGQRLPGGSALVSLAESITGAKETSEAYKRLVTNIVDLFGVSAHQAAAINGRVDGTPDQVQDASLPAASLVNQYSEDGLRKEAQARIDEWGKATVSGALPGAPPETPAP